MQQVWWSHWVQPVHTWEAKAVTIDFFPREAQGFMLGTKGLVWFCMPCVSVSKQSHQEAYNPSCRFTVNFLANFLLQFPALKLPYSQEQKVLSACSEVAMPFRDTSGSLQSLGTSCFQVKNFWFLHMQQKLQCKGLSVGWDFRNITH